MTGLKRPVFASRGTGRGRAGIEGRWRRRVGGPRLKVPSGPIRSRTPPAGQGRRRRGLPGPFQERRGPAPETGRGRGQAGPAPQAAARGQRSCAPPPPGPTRGVARVAAAVCRRGGGSFALGPPGAPGGPCAALTEGGQQEAKTLVSEAPSAVTSSFPGPILRRQRRRLQWRRRQQLPRLRNRRRRWRRQLHFRSGHHFRSGPSPAPPLRRLLIGRAEHGVAPAAREGR